MLIKSKNVWIDDQFQAATVEIENNQISNIFDYNHDADVDYGSKRIVPGFIDIHTHGGFGTDIMETNPEGIRNWTKNLPKTGVTSFLATTFTDSYEHQMTSIKNVVEVMNNGYEGSEILGINLEGPYLNKEYAGGMMEEYIVDPNFDEFNQFYEACDGKLKAIAYAPEKDKDYKFLDHLVSLGLVVSAGHTNATYEQIMEAQKHGLKNMNHVFNCMSPLKHRAPGCVGAAMLNDELYAELICDNAMVQNPAAKILSDMKKKDKLIFITDALAYQGFKEGRFMCGSFDTVIQADGSCIEYGTGMYLGSTIGLNDTLRNAIEKANIKLDWAIAASSLNAARMLGVDNRKGRIEIGYDADIVVMNDDYTIAQTYCRGISQL